jgi:hypothetical protein
MCAHETKVMYIPEVTLDIIVTTIKQLTLNEKDVVMLSLSETVDVDLDSMVVALDALGITFFGGVFPGVIGDGELLKGGAVLKVLPALFKPVLFQGITDNSFERPDCLSTLPEGNKGDAIVIVDGLSSNVSPFLAYVFNLLGNSVKYIGGGAGSLSLKQIPCLFSNEGVFQDAAIVLMLNKGISTGVKHGWKKLNGPFLATKTKGNVILEINWQNAFEVYKDIVESDSGQTLGKDNFFELSKAYPFGIQKKGSEYIVRDPISVDESGALVCVGEVSENVLIDVLSGDKSDLIDAAEEAADIALAHSEFSQVLLIDCISRHLFLADEYDKSLDVIQRRLNESKQEVCLEGMLTLGEISTYGKGYLELLNKSIVVGLL